MSIIQQQAIELIRQLPDDKVQAIITLAADEIKLMHLSDAEKLYRKKAAFSDLEGLRLDLPSGFDADSEYAAALGEKYGIVD